MIDYHLHTARCCHAEGTVEDYYKEAQRKGLKEIGFADHFPLDLLNFTPPVRVTMEGKELPEYIEEVSQLQLKRGNPDVKLGIEVDFLPDREEKIRKQLAKYPFDYVTGSVHFMGNWDFTNPEVACEYAKLKNEEIFGLYEEYYHLIEKVIQSNLFDITGHIDVIKKFGYRPGKSIQHFLEQVADLLRAADICIELNTAGSYAPVNEFYPGIELLKLCHRKKVPVTLGSDAHRPAEVGRDIDKALSLLKSIGYREVAVFKERKRLARSIV